MLDLEKPIVFTYEEILSSTDGFADSNLLGHGRYGSVYYGILRDQVCLSITPLIYHVSKWECFSSSQCSLCTKFQEVAIKRMTATKTKQFMAEMKVLCKVHHTNLVMLTVPYYVILCCLIFSKLFFHHLNDIDSCWFYGFVLSR